MRTAQKILGVSVDGTYGPQTHNAMEFIFGGDVGEAGCAKAKKV